MPFVCCAADAFFSSLSTVDDGEVIFRRDSEETRKALK